MKQHIHYRQGASARCPGSIPVHWLATALALLFWLSGPLAYAGEPVILSEGALRPAITVQKRNEDKLFAVPGALAVGVGTLQGTRTPAIHVYMNKTAPAASASALPAHLEGVPVEVIETVSSRPLTARRGGGLSGAWGRAPAHTGDRGRRIGPFG
jgi:hypothetical protein